MRIINYSKNIVLELNKYTSGNVNLLQTLQDNRIYISNHCHGNGTCGKCKVRIQNCSLKVTESEQKLLSKQELQQGIRLACKISVEELLESDSYDQLEVEILENQEENIVVESVGVKGKQGSNYFLAIDIGTTTIAMSFVDADTGTVCDSYVSINHQRTFGADVISRIVAANDGKLDRLKESIEQDLWKGIYYFLDNYNFVENKNRLESKEGDIRFSGIVIAGNTTMMHLLMGHSCESLGKYPFVSEYLEQREVLLQECIGSGTKMLPQWIYDIPVMLMPGVSAFVGSDIVAGMLACPGFEYQDVNYFLDLGTNGEMVLGSRDTMLATSVAAGPAFEGGNITCGTASIPGSISRVKITNRKPIIGTIGKKMPPIGICGSGLISVIVQLRKEKIIDFQGNLQYPFQKEGFPLWTFSNGEKLAIYQKDIRQFQMAKSAVRSGIEILKQKYGCQLEDVKKVYVAGGFGTNLTEEDILLSGLLPKEWEGKIEFLGNTSLLGSIKAGVRRFGNTEDGVCNLEVKQEYILDRIRTISLANDEEFKRLYIENLNFL